MSADTIHVVATFAVKADRVEEFIREATKHLVEPTLQEPGCIRYELCQDADDPTRFAMLECWESEQALQRHLAQPRLQQAVAALTPLAAEPPHVRRLRPCPSGS